MAGTVDGVLWGGSYQYRKDGNIDRQTVQGTQTIFGYSGDRMMTKGTNNTLVWDPDGRMTSMTSSGQTRTLTYNWDSKLRKAESSGPTVYLRYDPDGNRIFRQVGSTKRKYIVDTEGELPTILLEIDPDNSNPDTRIKKSYIYADSQILAQHNRGESDGPISGCPIYFYLHDRLGSVRQMIDTSAAVKSAYTYEPFGQLLENQTTANLSNPFMFTGQWYDSEFGQYFLRARQYDPAIYRFTARDPYTGSFREPMELHRYLYCLNDPMNLNDPSGWVPTKEGIAATTGTVASMMGGSQEYVRQGLLRAQEVISRINLRNFTQNLATVSDKGLELACRIGSRGEYIAQQVFGFVKNTAHYYAAAGNYRIPDGVVGNIIIEVKNVAYLNQTGQLRDLVELARQAGEPLVLVVRQGDLTKLSSWVLGLIESGDVLLAPILPAM